MMAQAREMHRQRGLPRYLKEFLQKGILPKYWRDKNDASRGRNKSCNQVARRLLYLGYDPDIIFRLFKNAPFPKNDFGEREMASTIESARHYVADQIKEQKKSDTSKLNVGATK